jgi:hypothetical protein
MRWAIFSISEARSPMTTQGAIVLPVVTRGIMEPSAIRRLSIPWTLSLPSTTDMESRPILAVQVWCQYVTTESLTKVSRDFPFIPPGITSRFTNGRNAAEFAISRQNSTHLTMAFRSSGSPR